ncbi:MAG: Phosphate-specific transport system accessory protein PhoU [Anaerolinea thermophila]|jgi:phosphate transport system protein|uniref:Phosphate-specific transport system accessory protein PhoU n=1 Tax=Anaerolinea thermophila TaxID=167964 RepID=A0A101FXM6_9CHLR|nr:MAG: Phosphate-specific transport system accessory protein PhoU [Anaerolinea thermophila]
MPRQTLDREIHHLQDEVLLLGSMVEQAMLNAIDTLKQRDKKAARLVYFDDERINEKRYAIENRVLILFATQQPIAHDLRLLAAILEVITELERMGDYAKGIAKITVRISDDETPIPIREITRMGDLAVSMLHRALSAFINEDVNMAYRIPKEDDLVDNLYNQVYHKNVNAMIANPEIIDQSSYIMWVVHNIERMADRVTNICERTIFIATGELLEIDISDDEWADEDEN